MGMTWRLHVLNGRVIESDGSDCSWMYRLSGYLDGCCRKLHLPPLTSFQDHTDLEANLSEDDGEAEPDAETGWSYGIDDMQWFEAADGLRVLEGVADHLDGLEAIPGIPAGRQDELFEELNGCIKLLEPAAENGGKFHLAVLM